MARLPVQAQVELTKQCNLTCDHCFARAQTDDTRHMSPEVLARTVSELDSAGLYWIQLTGGEPLLAPVLEQALTDTLTGPNPKQISILTNGSLWNEDWLQRVLAISSRRRGGELIIQVSFDAIDEHTFSLARNADSDLFNRTCDNIGMLVAAGLTVGGMLVVTSRNAGHAVETARFAVSELGMHSFAIVPLYVAGRALDHYDNLATEFESWAQTLREVTRIKRNRLWGEDTQRITANVYNFYELALPLEGTPYLESVWGLTEETLSRMMRPSFCEAGFSDVFVSYDGDVFPCPPASCIPEFRTGSVMEDSIEHIWNNSPVFEWFRAMPEQVTAKQPCRDCEHRRLCGGGCRIASKLQLGDATLPDPRCPIVKAWIGGEPDVAHTG